jgi:lipopolysaccharide heptosyltransferase II
MVVLIAGIGDLVLASKSLRCLKSAKPDGEIHLFTSTDAAPIALNYSYVDKVWSFPIRELRASKIHAWEILKLIHYLRRIEFETIINLYSVDSVRGAVKMGLLFLLLKAKEKIGHDNKGFGLFLTKKIPADTFHNKHRADAMMDAAILAGAICDNQGTEVYWNRRSENKWKQLFLSETTKTSRYVIGMSPGGDRENRHWKAEHYAKLADMLIDCLNAQIILLGSPAEVDIAVHIERQMRYIPINLTGQLSLDNLVYITNRLDLLVANDSGPMHIAIALKIPTVAIFGPSDPLITGPYASPKLFRVVSKDIHCRPCLKETCDHVLCLENLMPDEVLGKCVELLKSQECQDGAVKVVRFS